MKSTVRLGGALAVLSAFSLSIPAADPSAPNLKDEMRLPWELNGERAAAGKALLSIGSTDT